LEFPDHPDLVSTASLLSVIVIPGLRDEISPKATDTPSSGVGFVCHGMPRLIEAKRAATGKRDMRE
jgi:hypothetical protein